MLLSIDLSCMLQSVESKVEGIWQDNIERSGLEPHVKHHMYGAKHLHTPCIRAYKDHAS